MYLNSKQVNLIRYVKLINVLINFKFQISVIKWKIIKKN